jgi:hypothetical protein
MEPEFNDNEDFKTKMGYVEKKEKKEIVHSKDGKLVSSVAEELVSILKKEYTLFYREDSRDIVEIGRIEDKEGNSSFTGFFPEKADRFITQIEKFCVPVVERWNESLKQLFTIKKSINQALATTILSSDIMQKGLPKIKRIFTIQMPILKQGKLVIPKKGYDEHFESWMPFDAPEIKDMSMSIENAKEIIEGNILEEFCFETQRDKVTAIAGIITPFIRGLYSRFSVRTPLFFYIGNRERAGKDYLAGITGIIYEGFPFEEPPISTSENAKTNSTEELRKKILALMIYGRKRFHSSNNKGFINNAIFESVLTAEKYSDRILGRSENLTFDNELEFSLSGNTGIGFTPDLANRSKFIRLFLDIEDANSRQFRNPNLHGWVKENREMVLSAIYAFIRNWVEKGTPKGKVPFASFQEWSEICGGILEAAGYENICGSDLSAITMGVDTETADMKTLFEIGFETYPEQWVSKGKIKELIEGQDIFTYVNLNERSDQTKFGNKINKYVGRVLSGIRLIVRDTTVRSARQELMFTKKKDGNLGNFGKVEHRSSNSIINSSGVQMIPKLPKLPEKIDFSELDEVFENG